MKYIITADQLDLIKELLDEDIEYCGQIETDEKNQAKPKVQAKGGKDSCQNPDFSGIIWHTHPKHSKGYPSRSDILKVIKHPRLRASILFSPWGIWKMVSDRKVRLQDKYENEEFNQHFQKVLGPLEEQLYYSTSRGRQVDEDAVNTFISSISQVLGKYEYTLKFTPWYDIEDYNVN